MKKPEQWSRFDAADGLATEADIRATHWKNCWLSVTPMPRHQVEQIGEPMWV